MSNISISGLIVSLCIMVSATGGYELSRHYLVQTKEFDAHIENLPKQIGNWAGRDVQGLGVGPLDILKLDRYVRRIYSDAPGRDVLVYVGYWTKQSGEYQAAKHSPAVCLPSNGWSIDRLTKVSIQSEKTEPLVVNRIIGRLGQQRMLFHYWFFTGGTTYPSEWQALARIGFESFFHGRSDGGIVELTTAIPKDSTGKADLDAAERVLQDFAKEFAPKLSELIEQKD